jgi:hypothetical protein
MESFCNFYWNCGGVQGCAFSFRSPLLSKFILLFLKLDSLFSKIFPFGVSIIVLAEKS